MKAPVHSQQKFQNCCLRAQYCPIRHGIHTPGKKAPLYLAATSRQYQAHLDNSTTCRGTREDSSVRDPAWRSMVVMSGSYLEAQGTYTIDLCNNSKYKPLVSKKCRPLTVQTTLRHKSMSGSQALLLSRFKGSTPRCLPSLSRRKRSPAA